MPSNLPPRFGRVVPISVLIAVALFFVPQSMERPAPAASEAGPPPLLRWDVLRDIRYVPRAGITWSDTLSQFHDQVIRLEGYLMRKFGSQDPSDLLLTALHPSSLICGPTDMTAIVEIYYPGFDTDDWPSLPVEIVGTFYLSKNPDNLRYIYHLFGSSWRPLRRWEQDFPGLPDELRGGDRDGP